MKRRAFTMIELLVGIAVLAVLAGAFALSPKIGRQTARREAERIYSLLNKYISRAERTHKNFKIVFTQADNYVTFFDIKDDNSNFLVERVNASPGCMFKTTFNGNDNAGIGYSHVLNSFLWSFTIVVSRTDGGAPYYIMAYSPAGRLRMSNEPPENWK